MTKPASPTPAEILSARRRAGLTQNEAGKILGVGVRTWQKWEYGERKMRSSEWELLKIKIKNI